MTDLPARCLDTKICPFHCRSSDSLYDGYYQTVRVENNSSLTGQTASDPRVIPSFPFSVADSLALFTDSLSSPCSLPIAVSGLLSLHQLCHVYGVLEGLGLCFW